MMAEPTAWTMSERELEAWFDAHGIEGAELDGWRVRCPWCEYRPTAGLLLDATAKLAAHAIEAHPWQLDLLSIVLGGLRSEAAA